MQEIKKTTLEKSIKKAYKEGRDWNRVDRGHCYNIMIDTDDADIWCDCFTDENNWKQYHSDTISTLHWMDDCNGPTIADVEQAYLTDAIRTLTDYGWTIND